MHFFLPPAPVILLTVMHVHATTFRTMHGFDAFHAVNRGLLAIFPFLPKSLADVLVTLASTTMIRS